MEDKQIVQLYLDRNEEAISATAEKYGEYCALIAKNILSDKDEVEECIKDVYISAWNSIPPHNPKSLSVFLGSITRDLALKCYKKNAVNKRDGEVECVLEELAEFVSDTDYMKKSESYYELFEVIHSFLEKLSIEKRSIFICRYWYFDSISDIAKRFMLPKIYVSFRLKRLRLKLHDYLIERGFEL